MVPVKDSPVNVCVSIVIPCYNVEDFIAETIRSIQLQTFTDFEMIVVDDGSTDKTASVVSSLAEHDSRIFIVSKPNTGVSDSRNRGMQISRGRYIVFFDADDLMEPNFLLARVTTLTQNPLVAYCASGIITIDREGIPFGTYVEKPFSDPFEDILLYHINTVTCPSNFMCNAELLKSAGITFNTKLVSSADRFFWMELAERHAFLPVSGYDGAALRYRVHAGSMSNKISVARARDAENLYLEIKRKMYHRIPDKKRFKEKYYYMISGTYYHAGSYAKAIYYGMAWFWERFIGW